MKRFNKFGNIQHASARYVVKFEDYSNESNDQVMPVDRVPSLSEIVDMFVSGRPIDSSLERHLDFNDLERNPVLQKGFDLVDFSKVAKAANATLEKVDQEIQQAKLNRKSKDDTLSPVTEQAPAPVSTE